MGILALQVEDAGGLLGLLVAKLLAAEVLGVGHQVLSRELGRIPRLLEPEVDGELHGLQVADVQNPQFVDAGAVGEVELLPESLNLAHVEPLAVAGRSHVIDVVVHAVAAGVTFFRLGRLAALRLGGFGVGHDADVAPVVVAEQEDDVVGHLHAHLIVLLHLLVEGPDLRHVLGLLARGLGDEAALMGHDALHEGHVGLVGHRLIAVAAHTDGDDVLGVLHALDARTPEADQLVAVGVVVPGAASAYTGPLLVGLGAGLVVAGAHDDAHVVGGAQVLGVVGIEGG